MSFCYGAKIDPRDDRDHWYRPDEIPPPQESHVDLEQYVVQVYDQGKLNSCTANAVCSAYGMDLKRQMGFAYFDPSRLFLYFNTRELEGTTNLDKGACIRNAIKSINRQGVCPELDWPYDTDRFATKPPQECYDKAEGNTLCRYERLPHDINQFRACLKDGYPFVFNFKVFKSFHDHCNSKHGMMPIPKPDEKFYALHAVVAVGYDDTWRCVKILNSWGAQWGSRGYFYMLYDFIANPCMCGDFWRISFACQRNKPRPADAVVFPD